jgi:hypothetical protein
MARSRPSHGERALTANEAGISEERAEYLRKLAASLAKRQPGLMRKWLEDEEAHADEFNAALEAEEQRMHDTGEI